MEKNKLQLTSVKVHEHLFDEFKVACVRTKFSLQKLTDRAIHLYLTNDDFRTFTGSELYVYELAKNLIKQKNN
jgi:hypothetical protein